ncbi:SDR family oxidoreductase [Paracoccus sp. MBLB3053]|uniref:SDR family oxidoreductase n=1 Tax=Paracoccus aurantius TaxID=3073814 RepID=A0ABU2HXS1_9RHOB|nr:SDR family oxidoreductase [Paracoccus sp. MBLB3053]MDS9469833.1 SDR family oxidoreductase [Paracoccus sp. MBLB3053]
MTEKTALVFGGSRGIGAASVDALRADGWNVAFTYASSAESGGIRADLRDAASVELAFQEAQATLGPISCVVASAGINVPPGPLASFPPERMRDLVETNIIGAFNVLQAAARHVADDGSIIALTTSLVRHAAPGLGPYSASKAAVESLLRSAARELAPRGVRVNGVAPGPIDTDLFRAGKDEAAVARSAAMSPFNRVGRPEEVAATIAFLASDKASWISGQIVQPNGGLV